MSRIEPVRAMLRIGRRSESAVGLAIGLMLMAVAALTTIAPRALDRAEESSLERAVADAPAVLRRLSVRVIDDFPEGTSVAPLREHREVVDRAAEVIPDVVVASFGAPRVVVDSNRFIVRTVDETPPSSPTTVTFRVLPELEQHSRVVQGRAASATVERVGERTVLEIELSTIAAEVLGLELGAELDVVADTTDVLTRRYVGGLPEPFTARVVGLRELTEPSDPYWFGDARLHRPLVSDTGLGANFAFHAAIDSGALPDRPFVVDGRGPLLVEQRRDLLPAAVTVDNADDLLAGLIALEASTVAQPSPGRPGIAAGLRRVLTGEAEQRTVARSTLVLGATGVLAVAFAVLAQSLQVAFTRRRGWLAVARARGASPAHVVATTVLEVALVAGAAVVVGTLLARLAVGGEASSIETRLLAGLWLGSIVTAGLLTVAEVRRPVTVVARASGQTRLGKWGRVTGIVLVVAALGGLVTFRRRGLAVDTGEIDALVVLVPVLVPLAVVFLTRWVLPVVLGLVARIGMNLGPGRLLGVRRAIADPGAGTGLLAVLTLALTVAGLGLGINHSLERGIADASWADVGAPYRIDSRDPDVAAAVAAIPGIQLAEYGDNQFRVERGGDIFTTRMINVESEGIDGLTDGTAADLALPAALRTTDDEGRVPVVSAARIGGQRVRRGDVVRGTGFLDDVEFVAIAVRTEAFGHDRDWIITERTVFEEVGGREAPTSSLLFDVPPASRDELSALAGDEGLEVADRTFVEGIQRNDPLVRAIRRGYLAAGAAATLLALMGVAGLALVTARQRRREVAVLGLLGANRREIARAVRSELLGPVVAGVVLGTGLGWLMTSMFDGRFELSPFTDGAAVAFRPDGVGQLATAAAVALGALAVVVLLVHRIVRVRVEDVLRVDGAG